jgi:(p)ppGpp synthase/HD superfamily hydrolase
MAENIDIKEDYRLALCCNPTPHDKITGFLKPDSGIISVHKSGCVNLKSIEKERLIDLNWNEIINTETETDIANDPVFNELDETDIRILRHHAEMGLDYAAVVAKCTRIDRATVFKRHRKLRDLKLLGRVQPRMIQYRKNIADNKWIKHRNHTYYEITERGREIIKKNYPM